MSCSYFAYRGGKKEKEPKDLNDKAAWYNEYFPYKVRPKRQWGDKLRVLSVDPGVRNFCIRVEERRIVNGRCVSIVPLHYDKLDLKKMSERSSTKMSVYDVLSDYLLSIEDLVLTCHIVVMERQLPLNYNAVHISRHAMSVLCMIMRNSVLHPIIVDIHPKLKEKQLRKPKGADVKLWSVDFAKRLFLLVEDHESIQVIDVNKGKQDDLADTGTQIEALLRLMEMEGTVYIPELDDEPEKPKKRK